MFTTSLEQILPLSKEQSSILSLERWVDPMLLELVRLRAQLHPVLLAGLVHVTDVLRFPGREKKEQIKYILHFFYPVSCCLLNKNLLLGLR